MARASTCYYLKPRKVRFFNQMETLIKRIGRGFLGFPLQNIVSIGLVLVFYSFGRWLFFEILGVKFWAQLISITILSIFFLITLLQNHSLRASKAHLLIAAMLFFCLLGDVYRAEVFGAIEIMIGIFSYICILQMSRKQIVQCALVLIGVSNIFAASAIFITLVVSAGYMSPSEVYLNYNNVTEVAAYQGVNLPIVAFGMVTPYDSYDYYGWEIHRLMSLSSEPSRLSIYLVLPLTLSLVLGRKGIWGAPVLLFAALLTSSLSVLAPIVLAPILVIGHRLVRASAGFYFYVSAAICVTAYVGFLYYGIDIGDSITNARLQAQDTDYDDVVRGSAPVKFASMMLLIDTTLLYLPLPSSEPLVNGPLLFYVLSLGSVICLPLVGVVPYILLKTKLALDGSWSSQLVWFLVLTTWGLAMIFTTSPFYFTPAAIIGLTLLFRLMMFEDGSARRRKGVEFGGYYG